MVKLKKTTKKRKRLIVAIVGAIAAVIGMIIGGVKHVIRRSN